MYSVIKYEFVNSYKSKYYTIDEENGYPVLHVKTKKVPSMYLR